MKRTRLFVLVEGYLEGGLSEAERRELDAAVRTDEEARRSFVAEVRMARRLRVLLRPRRPGEAWDRVASSVAAGHGDRGLRTANAVEARITREARRRRGGRVAAAVGVLALAAGVVLIARRPAPPPAVPVASAPLDPGEPRPPALATAEAPPALPAAPPVAAAPTPPVAPPPAVRTTPGASLPGAVLASLGEPQEMAAAEGPAFARRPDLLLYGAFEGAAALPDAIRQRLRPAYTAFVPGLDGRALELRYQAGGIGPEAGGARFFVGHSAATASPPDEAYLRYYVRFAPDFDFAAGGLLPGLCGGKCVAPFQVADGRESFVVRLHWLPTGEIGFDPNLPGLKPRQKRWGRVLVPGTWHCLELHVRLNQPDQDDGLLEGWLDGDKAAELPSLRIRDVASLGVSGVAFESFFRGRVGAGPRREGRVQFDDMVVARSYVGPRAQK